MAADFLMDPLRGDFGPAVAAQLALVGAGCGAAGVWVVWFGRAFLAESLSHALLPGLVLASLLNASLVAGALAGLAAAYLLTLWTERAPGISPAAATSVSVTLPVGAGMVLASAGGVGGFEHLLFGDVPAASGMQVLGATALPGGIAVALWLLHERFAALAFDAGSAATIGVSPRLVQAAALLVLVVAVAAAVNLSGALPALALVVGPAIATETFCRRIGSAVAWSATIGAAGGLAGMYLSYHADLPAGASVALACVAMAAGGGALRRISPARTARDAVRRRAA